MEFCAGARFHLALQRVLEAPETLTVWSAKWNFATLAVYSLADKCAIRTGAVGCDS
jgi:hypothetical protein